MSGFEVPFWVAIAAIFASTMRLLYAVAPLTILFVTFLVYATIIAIALYALHRAPKLKPFIVARLALIVAGTIAGVWT